MDLLTALPVLERAIPPGDLAAARRTLAASLVALERGPWDSRRDQEEHNAFVFIVVTGYVLRESRRSGRIATQIFGPGDLLVPLRDDEADAQTRHLVHEGATVVALDNRYRAAAQRWPLLHEYVETRLIELAERTADHLALLHRPRADDRVMALFTDLGDRWGQVTLEGVLIPLALTHELIGHLVGARRTTVAEAASALAERHALVRRADGCWLLPPLPPASDATSTQAGVARSLRKAG